MKYILIITSVILILYLIVPTYINLKTQKKKAVSVVVKALGTTIAVAFGITGAYFYPSRHAYLILGGLILGLLGDIFLEFILPLGGFSFFFGNILYVYCMLSEEPLRLINIILLVLFLTFLAMNFGKDFHSFGKYRYLILGYAILVSLMAAVAIPYILLMGYQGLLFGFGVFLFAISDYLLGYRTLYNAKPPFHRISLSTYYLAQLCIGVSLFMPYL